jgi:hypothetical protein
MIYLEPIPKFDRNIAYYHSYQHVPSYYIHNKNKNRSTIIKISDDLWDRISNLLPPEKPKDTVDRSIISFRNVFDVILYVLRTGCQ